MAKVIQPRKEILAFLQPAVSMTVGFAKGTGTAVDGRTIIKAGTVVGGGFKENLTTKGIVIDALETGTPEGVVLYDIDTTDGDTAGAVLIHGFVNTSLIETVAADIQEALPLIDFIAMGKGGN